MSWDEGLHEKQIQAAEFSGTHARLLAGPGTGKTVTLVKRVIKLITQDSVSPKRILVLAFTRINAFELRRTLSAELENHGEKIPHVSTLHSYALRQLLRNSALLTTLPQPLRIADDFEEKFIIRPDLRKILNINDKEVKAKFADMSSDWQSLAVEDTRFKPADPQFLGAWRNHRSLYGYTLRSELIWQLKHAWDENPDTFQIEGEINHLLVDEYQDLNKCDLEVIKKLSVLGAEVFCVGDDDQSIYYFRRAHPEGIRRFLDDYSPSTSLELEVCWRCDDQIIELGQFVANQDPNREPKPIRARQNAGIGEVHLLQFSHQNNEAIGVSLICQYLIDQEGCKPDDILILLRSDHQGRYSRPLISALSQIGIPYKVKGDRETVLDYTEGRYLLCLIRLLINSNDHLTLRTLFQFVGWKNNIGEKTIEAIENYATSNGLLFSNACSNVESNPYLIKRGMYVKEEMKSIRDLLKFYHSIREIAPKDLEDDKEITNARNALIGELSKLAEEVIQNEDARKEVVDYISEIAFRSNAFTLEQLLASITSPEDTLDQELEPGKINILTMHRAKGLSARSVIIVGAEGQLIPGNVKGLEEVNDSRRLLYVSLTRAKEFLYITHCNRRTGHQSHSGSDPDNPLRTLTPFLRGGIPVEMGIDYLRSIGKL